MDELSAAPEAEAPKRDPKLGRPGGRTILRQKPTARQLRKVVEALSPLKGGKGRYLRDDRILERPELWKPLGEALAARTLLLMRKRIELAEQSEAQVEALLRQAKPNWKLIAAIRRACLFTNFDILNYNRELQDRYGQPRRTVEDINLSGGITPIRLILHDDEEASDVAGTAADDAAQLIQ